MEQEKIIDIVNDLLQECYNDLFEYGDLEEEKAKTIYQNVELFTLKFKDRIKDLI